MTEPLPRRFCVHGVAEMVAVTVRDEDEVHFAESLEILVFCWRPGVLREKGIDDNDLARGTRDAESGMPQI